MRQRMDQKGTSLGAAVPYYDEGAADLAWARTVAVLKKHLY